MANRRDWTHNETVDFINTAKLLKLVEESDSKRSRNGDLFRTVRNEMERQGHDFTITQIRRKWKSLKQQYYKALGNLSASGSSSKPLKWPYFTPMHEILRSRPRSESVQPGFGLESQEEPHDNIIDAEVENAMPQDGEIILTPIDSTEEAPHCSTPTSNRIHGKSRTSERRRSRKTGQYHEDFQNMLSFMKESEDRYMHDMELQRQNEAAENAAQRRHETEQTDRVLHTINNIANAIVLTIQSNRPSNTE